MVFVLFLLDSGYAITCFQKGSFPLGYFFFFFLVLSVPVSVISGFSAISKRLRGRDRNSFSYTHKVQIA